MQTVIAKELGPRNELPPAVSIPGATGSWEKSGFLSPQYNPFNAGNPNADKFKVRDIDLPMGVDWSRMDHRRSLLVRGGRKIPPPGYHRHQRQHGFVLPDGVRPDAFREGQEGVSDFRRARGRARQIRPHVARAGSAAGAPAGRIRRALRDRVARLQHLGPPSRHLSAAVQRFSAGAGSRVSRRCSKISTSAACSIRRS